MSEEVKNLKCFLDSKISEYKSLPWARRLFPEDLVDVEVDPAIILPETFGLTVSKHPFGSGCHTDHQGPIPGRVVKPRNHPSPHYLKISIAGEENLICLDNSTFEKTVDDLTKVVHWKIVESQRRPHQDTLVAIYDFRFEPAHAQTVTTFQNSIQSYLTSSSAFSSSSPSH